MAIESGATPASVTIASPGPAATSTIWPTEKLVDFHVDDPAKRVATVEPDPTMKVPAGEALIGIGPTAICTGACQAPFTGL